MINEELKELKTQLKTLVNTTNTALLQLNNKIYKLESEAENNQKGVLIDYSLFSQIVNVLACVGNYDSNAQNIYEKLINLGNKQGNKVENKPEKINNEKILKNDNEKILEMFKKNGILMKATEDAQKVESERKIEKLNEKTSIDQKRFYAVFSQVLEKKIKEYLSLYKNRFSEEDLKKLEDEMTKLTFQNIINK